VLYLEVIVVGESKGIESWPILWNILAFLDIKRKKEILKEIDKNRRMEGGTKKGQKIQGRERNKEINEIGCLKYK
jgi:hypothetical protein